MHRTRSLKALMLALALAAMAAVAVGCGDDEGTAGERAVIDEEAHREGLAEDLAGIEYNVFITRQLNLSLPEDKAYYDGPAAPPGSALYGVFLEACNRDTDGEPRETAEEFHITDTQGNEFEPIELPEDNPFAYHAGRLGPRDCIPAKGSIPQLGPTGGAMLLFQLPQEATENRPLELEILAPAHAGEGGEREKLAVELDI